MSTSYVEVGNLRIDQRLFDLIEEKFFPGTSLQADNVWGSLGDIVATLGPRNRQLLQARDERQSKIDARLRDWRESGEAYDPKEMAAFYGEIGYLIPEGESFIIGTCDVDREISEIAGPQLVVPLSIERFATNAANARWVSMQGAVYFSDLIAEGDGLHKQPFYNPKRGARVVEYIESLMDRYFPLDRDAQYAQAKLWQIVEENESKWLRIHLADGSEVSLKDPGQCVGWTGSEEAPTSVLLRHHGLHVIIKIDPDGTYGREHHASVQDYIVESAVTTILDMEDSISRVDAEDMVVTYSNLIAIMRGELLAEWVDATTGKKRARRLNEDKTFKGPGGGEVTLPGRALLLIRNVGLHMYTDAITTADGEEIPEGFLDVMITAIAAIHDVRRLGELRNSRCDKIYIVKPKLHGPEEVAATVELFEHVEQALGLPDNTLMIGIMDEERRTTCNLLQSVRAASERVVFINTGFLDRTGDDIHTNMQAGAMIPKPEIKCAPWMLSYEDRNVDIGLETDFAGRAQIGKGMYPKPELMAELVETKIAHPQAGANCAWVPSPTGAALHAWHYHEVDVGEVQQQLKSRARAGLDEILTPALLDDRRLGETEIAKELDNNCQGILGYVSRWIMMGIGCSSVPDINGVKLMEDRATLRISSQHIANWMLHKIVTRDQVMTAMKRMAALVDEQNEDSQKTGYRPMAPDFEESLAFQAALQLVFDGANQPNGYTEPILHRYRRRFKGRAATEASALS
jgi:malate synthase